MGGRGDAVRFGGRSTWLSSRSTRRASKRAASSVDRGPIPLTVLGGYLGAGKTTLLNKMLTETKGRRLGVIVNDVGEISVDAALVADQDGDTMTLANGCVCCSLADGFAAALDQLRDPARGIDHIVVEVSGVGDPWRVAQWGRTPGFALDTVLVLADAETIVERAAHPRVGDTVRGQLAGADLIMLTHLDLADDPDRVVADLTGWLDGVTPAPVVTDTEMVLIAILAPTPPPARTGPNLVPDGGGASRARVADTDDRSLTDHAVHVVRSVPTPSIRSRNEWRALLEARPTGVVRVKGIIDADDGPLLVQVAGRRVEITARPADGPRTPLVTIALPDTDPDAYAVWLATL